MRDVQQFTRAKSLAFDEASLVQFRDKGDGSSTHIRSGEDTEVRCREHAGLRSNQVKELRLPPCKAKRLQITDSCLLLFCHRPINSDMRSGSQTERPPCDLKAFPTLPAPTLLKPAAFLAAL